MTSTLCQFSLFELDFDARGQVARFLSPLARSLLCFTCTQAMKEFSSQYQIALKKMMILSIEEDAVDVFALLSTWPCYGYYGYPKPFLHNALAQAISNNAYSIIEYFKEDLSSMEDLGTKVREAGFAGRIELGLSLISNVFQQPDMDGNEMNRTELSMIAQFFIGATAGGHVKVIEEAYATWRGRRFLSVVSATVERNLHMARDRKTLLKLLNIGLVDAPSSFALDEELEELVYPIAPVEVRPHFSLSFASR